MIVKYHTEKRNGLIVLTNLGAVEKLVHEGFNFYFCT